MRTRNSKGYEPAANAFEEHTESKIECLQISLEIEVDLGKLSHV